MVPLAALGLVQLLEPKIPALASTRGRIAWIVLKLVLGYLVIGYTGAIESHFWLVLLLPVVTAAATFGLLGTLLFSIVASGFYLSFLLYINWTQMTVEGQDLSELVARVAFLAMAGNLANSLAEDLRVQSEKHRRTAEHLAEANRQVHAGATKPCGAPTDWRRWASSPRAWRTSCAIRWAPSRRRPKC